METYEFLGAEGKFNVGDSVKLKENIHIWKTKLLGKNIEKVVTKGAPFRIARLDWNRFSGTPVYDLQNEAYRINGIDENLLMG